MVGHIRIGDVLRSRRKALGLTLDQVGRYIGRSRGQVSRYETGREQPPLDLLEAMCARYGISMSQLYREASSKTALHLVGDPVSLTQAEEQLIHMYREMDDTLRARLLDLAQILADRAKPSPSN